VILPHLRCRTEERAASDPNASPVARRICARHVDIDLENALAKLEGVLAARERIMTGDGSDRSFPQSGVMRCQAFSTA